MTMNEISVAPHFQESDNFKALNDNDGFQNVHEDEWDDDVDESIDEPVPKRMLAPVPTNLVTKISPPQPKKTPVPMNP